MYLKGSPYRDAEGSSHIRSCIHYAIINAAPRIGGEMEKLELYRQCTPRRVKDTHMKEFGKMRMCIICNDHYTYIKH